ncbi:MAG: hypothetical protein OEM32_06310 [Acidimicrobiia bacterium]|nr:hypothetical protein [Acidimicrobiia bacterium]
MTIWEYLQEPHPWFDTGNYEPYQIALFLIGALLWVLVYFDTIRTIVKFKVVNIPLVAICLNFGFETTTSFFFVPNMGNALVVAYWAWMVLDVFIVYSMFRYGWKQIRTKTVRDALPWLLPVGVVMGQVLQYFFITSYDLPMAPLSGYIISVEMTILYVSLLFLSGDQGQTRLTGWSKFLGNLLISIMFFTKYPENHFLQSLCVTTAFFDIWYIRLLYKLNIGKWRRALAT